MLLFKKKFLPAIRSGEKTQSIRLWKVRHMRAGQRSYIPGVGRIRITSVEPVDIESLTDADALPDGFPSAAALRTELRTIYGDKLADGYQAFRIAFECVAEPDIGAGDDPARRTGVGASGELSRADDPTR